LHYQYLGDTGIRVSRLCYGSLTLGPLQQNLSLHQGSSLIRRALEGGINFIDTAEIYDTSPYISRALRGWYGEVVVATKAYVYTREQARKSLENARKELDREVVDIFLLHEQESRQTLEGHRPALEYLNECREKGIIKATGISTHFVEAVRVATLMPEVQIIHPLVNLEGTGIRDGSASDMVDAIGKARENGKGIYAMKPLAGGHLLGRVDEALGFARDKCQADSIAVGLGNPAEIDYALNFFGAKEVPEEVKKRAGNHKKKLLHLPEECNGCLSCLEACPQDALTWDGGPVIDEAKCLCCGYCGAACPTFCWRII